MGSAENLLGKHNVHLQSLRGIAALSVLIGHSAIILYQGAALRIVNSIFQPGTAVVFFYVLSGFVLQQSLVRSGGSLFGFAVRRLTRLYPIVWTSVLLAVAVSAIIRHPPLSDVGPWFQHFLDRDIAPATVGWNLLTVETQINGNLWSVQVELIMIVLLPVMVFFSRWVSLAVDIAVLAGLFLLLRFSIMPVQEQYPKLIFVPYLACFYLGVTIPKLLAEPRLERTLKNGQAICLELVIYFLLYHVYNLGTGYTVGSLISAHIIMYTVLSPERVGFLNWPVLVWLGDISYSFYAYGTVILTFCAFFVLELLPEAWRTTSLGCFMILTVTLIATFAILCPLASASFQWVEKPSIDFGRRLSKLIRP